MLGNLNTSEQIWVFWAILNILGIWANLSIFGNSGHSRYNTSPNHGLWIHLLESAIPVLLLLVTKYPYGNILEMERATKDFLI